MFARGSRHGLSYVAETTYGTTPATPSMLRLRHTGTTLNLTKESFTSEELRSDRMIRDVRHGNRQTGGDVNIELSYGAFDDLLAGALFGTWATDVLKAGTDDQSFTMERRLTDIGQYLVFTGCMVNTMSLTIQPNAMVTGSFGVVGKDMTIAQTSLGSPTDVATNAPFDSFTGTLTEGGATIASVTSLELSLNNGIEPTFVVGSASVAEMIDRRSNLTGTISAYFENQALLEKFLNETESSLVVTLTDLAGNDLEIAIPRLKYSGGDVPVDGEGPMVMSLPFQALLDDTESTNIKITRTPIV